MKIKSLKCTCSACPSQWEGLTERNEALYIRYRWGRLTIQLSEQDGTIRDAIISGRILYQKQIGDEFGGVIDIEEVMEIMKKEYIIQDVL